MNPPAAVAQTKATAAAAATPGGLANNGNGTTSGGGGGGNELNEVEQRIVDLCTATANSGGLNDLILQQHMADVGGAQRLEALNRLLQLGKLDIFRHSSGSLNYKLRNEANTPALMNNADVDEKLVYAVIKEAGNKGIWMRDITRKTNMNTRTLAKTLKNLEKSKLIKSVASVNANKKKIYMLWELEPDRSVTGGAWYSGKEFDEDFVKILNIQCYEYLCNKLHTARLNSRAHKSLAAVDAVAERASSFAAGKEVCEFIASTGISNVELSVDDIESILNTLVFDGKVERAVKASLNGLAHLNMYRAVSGLVLDSARGGTPLVRMPCAFCAAVDTCHEGGVIQPSTCLYMKEWLEF